MKAETYLRRALFAPIIVPLLAAVPLVVAAQQGKPAPSGVAEATAMALLYPLVIGGIPYLWTLYSKRDDLRGANGRDLEAVVATLPLKMLPYFWMFWGVLTLLLVPAVPNGYGFFAGLATLFVGMFAVPIVGYLYIFITFAFLRASNGFA